MNVFVLCTGRNGSTSFSRACEQIHNYTTAHQSRSIYYGEDRYKFPDMHIESDNRLAWFLGRLDKSYGDDAYYVHLKRDIKKTASSFKKTFGNGITGIYYPGLITRNVDYEDEWRNVREELKIDICTDMIETVNANIELFLKDKTNKITIELEDPKDNFRQFLQDIGAEGDIDKAIASWDVRHNANEEIKGQAYTPRHVTKRARKRNVRYLVYKVLRAIRYFPAYLGRV